MLNTLLKGINMGSIENIFGHTPTVQWGNVQGDITLQSDLTDLLSEKLDYSDLTPTKIKELYHLNINTHQFTSDHKDNVNQVPIINVQLIDQYNQIADINLSLSELEADHHSTSAVAHHAHDKAHAIADKHDEVELTLAGLTSSQNTLTDVVELNKIKISTLEECYADLTGQGGGNLDIIRHDIIDLKNSTAAHQRLLTSVNTLANSADQRSKENNTAIIAAELRLEALEGQGDTGTLSDRMTSIECDTHSVKHVLVSVEDRAGHVESRADKIEHTVNCLHISLSDFKELVSGYEKRITALEELINNKEIE